MLDHGLAANRACGQAPARDYSDALEIGGKSHDRARSGLGIAGQPLTVIEVDSDIIAHPVRQARTGVDPVQPRLGAAPQAEAAGEIPVQRASEGQRAVDEAVALASANRRKPTPANSASSPAMRRVSSAKAMAARRGG